MSSGTSLAIEDEEDDDTGSLSSMRGKPSVMLGGAITGTDIKAPSVGELKGDTKGDEDDEEEEAGSLSSMRGKRSVLLGGAIRGTDANASLTTEGEEGSRSC